MEDRGDDDDEHVGPCLCGSVAVGGLMGFFCGIVALLVLNSKLALVLSIALGSTFGNLGSMVSNPCKLDVELFTISVYILLGALGIVVYLFFEDFSLFHILAMSFASSTLISRTTPWLARQLKRRSIYNSKLVFSVEKDDKA